ncbi:hypothetical protein CIG19_09085 [Enterobacterales bacterium CwR94]|nr:hypothetical protein CIG19_09085 [Enterobacterales bacterium CwR94]
MTTGFAELAPREKLARYGAEALTDIELLAIFLRTGAAGKKVVELAKELLETCGSLQRFAHEQAADLLHIKGIGPAKHAQLRAIVELSQRIYRAQLMQQDALLSPQITKIYLQQLIQKETREVFVVVYLDNQHRMIETVQMFSGSVRSVEVHPREIVRGCLAHNAAALILAHNHPSGMAEPSLADKEITQQIVDACALVSVRVLDHIVVGRGHCVSFTERGWL